MARKPEIYLTDTIETWRQKTNKLSAIVGEPDDLDTTDKTDIVSAINEIRLSSGSDFIRSQISVLSTGGGNYASLSYNQNNGVLTFTSNSLQASDIPEIDASKVPTGVFNASQIPSLDASKITTGILDIDRLPQSVRDAAAGFESISTTDDIPEGTSNFYFSTERARQSISAGSNITYNSTTGVISASFSTTDLKVDPDYDAPTDRLNNWAAHSLQSVYFFLDTNNTEGNNYFGIYNNLDPYSNTVNRDNSIFRVDETGDVKVTGTISWPENLYGGAGDTAKIYVENQDGQEGTQLTLEVTNDGADQIHFKAPSDNGVKINNYTVLHEGNIANTSLTPNTPVVAEATVETIQNSGVYYFNSDMYPTNVTRPPDDYEIILVCKIPQHGYITGDEIYYGQSSDPSGSEEGIVITRHAESLLLQLRIGENGPGLVTNKNSGTGHVLTAANWSVKARFKWWGSDGNYSKAVTNWLSTPSGTPTVTIEGNLSGNQSILVPANYGFGNIAVAGQSSVTATENSDTLNVVAGTNITITTNGSDSITINSSAEGGGGTGVGVNQSWVSVTTSRSSGVSNENLTGSPIMVSAVLRSYQSGGDNAPVSASLLQVSSDNLNWLTVASTGTQAVLEYISPSIIIPVNHYYRFIGQNSGISELR